MNPLVSIFCFCRNRKEGMRRAAESVLAQTYRPIEFVVQDGASDDGTVELLRSYGEEIKLVSEKDAGPEEAFWKAMRRCEGEIIGSCLSDEVMMPEATAEAVDYMLEHPHVSALTRGIFLCDETYRVIGTADGKALDVHDYMHSGHSPHFAATFFRKKSLEKIGLYTRAWNSSASEFELWCRLGLCTQVAYLPGHKATYGVHGGQLSRNPDRLVENFRGRLQVLKNLLEENLIEESFYRTAIKQWGRSMTIFLDTVCSAPARVEQAKAILREVL